MAADKKLRLINLFDSSWSQNHAGTSMSLGLDTEFTILDGAKTLYPHEFQCPQERPTGISSPWRGGLYDWHGDGYAWELCIAPSYCIELALSNAGGGLAYLNQRLSVHYKPAKPPLQYTAPTLYTIPRSIATAAPPEVSRLGCAPSFNVYGDPGNPESLGSDTRTTGCHIHVSHSTFNVDKLDNIVLWADILVGAFWTAVAPVNHDEERQRRGSYGRAGEHRKNIYPNGAVGVEYRVLPGSVMRHPAYLTTMWNLYRHAVLQSLSWGEPPKELSAQACQAINESSPKLAPEVMQQLNFEDRSKQWLNFLSAHNLKQLDIPTWHTLAQSYYGHQKYFNAVTAGMDTLKHHEKK